MVFFGGLDLRQFHFIRMGICTATREIYTVHLPEISPDQYLTFIPTARDGDVATYYSEPTKSILL